MKVYISADIEGIAGIAHFDECNRAHPDWAPFAARMTEAESVGRLLSLVHSSFSSHCDCSMRAEILLALRS